MLVSIKRKIAIVLIVLVLVLNSNIYAVVKPTSNFYVNDYATLLSSETEQYIINVNRNLESKTGAQVVVVTIQSLNGEVLEEYATDLFRDFGIGDKTKNNGVLLLLALEERQFRVEVGYGLEEALNDSKTGRIQDQYIIPYLKNNQWDEGIKNGFDAVVQEVCKEYGITVNSDEPVSINTTEIASEDMQQYSWSTFCTMIVGVICGIGAKSKKMKVLKALGVTALAFGIISAILWLIVPIKAVSLMMIVINGIITLTVFTVACAGGTIRFGGGSGFSSGGGRSSGGFSGGGGRSGGGGSSRSF